VGGVPPVIRGPADKTRGRYAWAAVRFDGQLRSFTVGVRDKRLLHGHLGNIVESGGDRKTNAVKYGKPKTRCGFSTSEGPIGLGGSTPGGTAKGSSWSSSMKYEAVICEFTRGRVATFARSDSRLKRSVRHKTKIRWCLPRGSRRVGDALGSTDGCKRSRP